MNRKEHIERIIIGSVLTNGEYLREIQCLSRDDFQDLIDQELFDMLPDLVNRAGDRMPLDVLFEDEEVRIQKGNRISAICLQAIELSGTCDFDWNKLRYNLEALTEYYFCAKPYKPTAVEFRDYVSKFIQYGSQDNAA